MGVMIAMTSSHTFCRPIPIIHTGALIRQRRRALGWTQLGLAARLHIPVGQVRRMECQNRAAEGLWSLAGRVLKEAERAVLERAAEIMRARDER